MSQLIRYESRYDKTLSLLTSFEIKVIPVGSVSEVGVNGVCHIKKKVEPDHALCYDGFIKNLKN